jgi:hypothetical protein
MKSVKDDQRSPFAVALARLLDETYLLTRQQWAELLDVTPAAISQWVNDKTIPRPEVLRMLIDAIEESSAPPAQILTEFRAISRRPATEVSPHGERLGTSVGHYIVKPLLDGFLRNMYGLDSDAQERVLYKAAEMCRQIRQTGATAWDGFGSEPPENLSQGWPRSRAMLHNPSPAGTVTLKAPAARYSEPALAQSEAPPAQPDVPPTDDDPEDEDSVTKTLVVSGEKQARLVKLIDRYQGLRLATNNGEAASPGAAHFEVVGKFYLDDEDRLVGQGAASCVVVLWSFQAGENLFQPFPLDEMIFFPLSGEFEWQYEGDVEPVRLGAHSEHSDLMWMTAGKYKGPDRGLPPCRVTAGENAIGLGVFYSKHGVKLRPAEARFDLRDPRVELESMHWSQATVRAFWANFRNGGTQLAVRLPFVARVPCTSHELSSFVDENKILVNPDRKVKHDPARSKGQLSDARLRLWDDWKDAVLFPRIVKFHAWPPEKESEICMDHHTGREIIVPLGGAFKCLYANLEPEDTELYELCSADLKDRIKRRYVRSAEVSGQDYSDILLLCSNSAHGFTGIEGEDSYCLHIACRAYPHGIQQPRRRRSESVDLGDRQRRTA